MTGLGGRGGNSTTIGTTLERISNKDAALLNMRGLPGCIELVD
jgi:hypothetical protein